ncbi:4566_t:CDS:2 [Diversispora eburnea]|uniref:4566_t:CDS:1 n=1 Tax=Diversispora eburnea TaxID=1213867 RepID=A0A9N9C1V1_9GLOM|nr:4566_t:CDS:2 [Diversispora eburnea]
MTISKASIRKQFPLQNAFALTVHKVQGLTLPHVTTTIDKSIFAKDQAYIAMSCATSWENLCIINFNHKYLKSPRAALNEYKRLNTIHTKGFQNLQ